MPLGEASRYFPFCFTAANTPKFILPEETLAPLYAAKSSPSISKKGTQNKPFWQASKVYDTLTAVAAAAQQDYKVNGAKRGWMSKNGKLYGYYDACQKGLFCVPFLLSDFSFFFSSFLALDRKSVV